MYISVNTKPLIKNCERRKLNFQSFPGFVGTKETASPACRPQQLHDLIAPTNMSFISSGLRRTRDSPFKKKKKH